MIKCEDSKGCIPAPCIGVPRLPEWLKVVFYAGFGEWRWQKKMDSFYRRFVRNFVSIAAPLHALFALSSPKKNRQGQPLPAHLFGKHWSPACEVDFKTQTEVCVCPGIGICRFFKAFTLEIATRGWEPSCLRMFTDRGGQLHMQAGRSMEQRGIWKIVVP